MRGGLALYGYPPSGSEEFAARDALGDARHLRQDDCARRRVSYGGTFEAKRPTVVMTVPVGYADGYRRGISGKGCVLVRGKRARFWGACAWIR